MKLRASPESLIERIGLWLGRVPVPVIDTHIGATLTHAVVAATELGIFEALEEGPRTAPEIATACGTDGRATALLLEALEAADYVTSSEERYALTAMSRKWLLAGSPTSMRPKLLMQAIETQWQAHLGEFVRTGRPLEFHDRMSDAERHLYHRSMRALAGLAGGEIARRTPVPTGATRMIDLGGSHGHFAACLCRRHPQLSAEVLDLPDAIAHAAPLLAAEHLGPRLRHVAGDVIAHDLGRERYDLVFMSNLAHHLDAEQNAALAQRVAAALKPGGLFVIQDAVRETRRKTETGAFLGLYFGMQSRAGTRTWGIEDMRAWQSAAGLKLRRPLRLRTAPGWVQQAARR